MTPEDRHPPHARAQEQAVVLPLTTMGFRM
jgi:hypothetical protein